MCYTGKCPHEDYWGECKWDWDQEGWPDGCLPTSEQEEEIEMEYYSIIYANKKLETIVSFVKAEHYFAAEDKAKEDVQNWPHYRVYSINWLDKKRVDAGEVVFCGA